MLRKIFGIAFYIMAGFFLYSVELLAFLNEPMYPIKLILLGVLGVLTVVFTVIAILIYRSGKWRKNLGILLVSASGFCVFVIFSFFCFLLTPEFRESIPDGQLTLFSNYGSGFLFVGVIILVGVMLIKIDNKKDKVI
ncbi:hypothetical protein [Orenia marismortui]|uniref:hypothetical protein n=1 Tax=Orenia marismortui TaxID=46469 RepID=UPI00036EC9CD|nr:hypothetical protein [Orenia marismortui]